MLRSKNKDRERDRIYSRICETADFFLVEGEDRRRKMLAKRLTDCLSGVPE